MEALSLATAVITFYSAVLQLKKLKDSYSDAPDIIRSLEYDCDVALIIILHTMCRLQSHDRHYIPDDTSNSIDIRDKLRKHITALHPEVEALQKELAALLRPPKSNYDVLKIRLMKALHVFRLHKRHKNIVEKLRLFDRLLRSVDGDNIDFIRRNSWRNSTRLDAIHVSRRRDSIQGYLSNESNTSGEVDAAIPCSTESVLVSDDSQGSEVLLDAITGSRHNDVKMILRVLRVNPNIKNEETGMYPLHVATLQGNLVMMEELLKFHASIEARDKQGATALHIAARKDMERAVELLLRYRADGNAEDKDGHSPLWHAAWYGDSPKVFQMLTRPNTQGTDIINYHCHDPRLPTALWAAAAAPCILTARALLEAGSRTDVFDDQGSTLLHKAAWPIATELVPLLLDRDADVWARDNEGKLPLHRAAAAGKISIVEALLKRMGTGGVDKTDGEGATALIRGAQRGSLPVVRCLAEKWKATYSVQDQWGNGAFYYASANGHILVATYLLGLGAEINEGNKKGNTPLHVAARWGHIEMVRLLLTLGADRTARSSQEAPGITGQATPAEVASSVDIATTIETFEQDDEPVTWRVEMINPRRTSSRYESNSTSYEN